VNAIGARGFSSPRYGVTHPRQAADGAGRQEPGLYNDNGGKPGLCAADPGNIARQKRMLHKVSRDMPIS